MDEKNQARKERKDWQYDLAEFFQNIERENKAFGENVVRRGKFYAETVRPALDALKNELNGYGRECRIGLDQDRVYIIVRKADGAVEFQYAVVADATIEAVTPFAHCWFEVEDGEDDEAEKDGGGGENDEKDNSDDENDDEANDESDESNDDKSDEKSDSPKRVKTVEPFAGWTGERELESISQDEIIGDFLTHYKEAVSRLRAKLHAADKEPKS